MTRVLIVDDDPVQLRLTAEIARAAGFDPVTADGGDAALALLRGQSGFGAVILDLVMPDRDGMAVMDAMARDGIAVPVIVQTAQSALEAVGAAMRRGALDFFVKPVVPERLVVSLRNALKLSALEGALRSIEARRDGRLSLTDIATRAPAMQAALDKLQRAARSAIPVLIEGEAGTGKNLAARVIHAASDRAARPFVTLDCAQPLELTRAVASAQSGTLCLENIGALPAPAQAALADFLARPGDVRIIATTRRRLLGIAQATGFHQDLYYRLNVFPIYLPPLRDRPEDIEPLARRLLARLAAETGHRAADLSSEALTLLAAYDWPGNVRQLENVLHRALALSAGGSIEPADLPQLLAQLGGRDEARRLLSASAEPSAPVHVDAAIAFADTSEMTEAHPDRFLTAEGDIAPLEAVERELIVFALHRYGGRMSQVARALRIGRSTLYRKLHDYGLDDTISGRAA